MITMFRNYRALEINFEYAKMVLLMMYLSKHGACLKVLFKQEIFFHSCTKMDVSYSLCAHAVIFSAIIEH